MPSDAEVIARRLHEAGCRDGYWLYVVTNCESAPDLQEPVSVPARFPWHEVTKVQHYWLEVNAMTRPMRPREEPTPYEGPGSGPKDVGE